MMLQRTLVAVALGFVAAGAVSAGQSGPGLRFEVTLDPSLPAQPPGRLLVVVAPSSSSDRLEPRRLIGRTGRNATPTIGVDAPALSPGESVTLDLDGSAASFPIESLAALPAGEYRAQAVLSTNRDLRLPNAPGNLYSDSFPVTLDSSRRTLVRLSLTHRIPDEQLPGDDNEEHLRFIRIRSDRLSEFHGRPIYLRAGLILPLGYGLEPGRRYPIRVHTSAHGTQKSAR